MQRLKKWPIGSDLWAFYPEAATMSILIIYHHEMFLTVKMTSEVRIRLNLSRRTSEVDDLFKKTLLLLSQLRKNHHSFNLTASAFNFKQTWIHTATKNFARRRETMSKHTEDHEDIHLFEDSDAIRLNSPLSTKINCHNNEFLMTILDIHSLTNFYWKSQKLNSRAILGNIQLVLVSHRDATPK